MAGVSDRIPLEEAEHKARYLRDVLADDCERIEIAGSVRRRQATVKDIELVAIPTTVQVPAGLFGDVFDIEDKLEQRIAQGIRDGWLAPRDVEIHRKDGSIETGRRMGERYKALVYMGIPVDLFIVRPPADWGVVFTIRTGPAEWSERLVTDCQRFFLRVEHGALLHFGDPIPCPEERDFFDAIGQAWVEPSERHPDRVQLRRPAEASA